ncbi:unnamed protein product, partial [Prorocentrum cordatum]
SRDGAALPTSGRQGGGGGGGGGGGTGGGEGGEAVRVARPQSCAARPREARRGAAAAPPQARRDAEGARWPRCCERFAAARPCREQWDPMSAPAPRRPGPVGLGLRGQPLLGVPLKLWEGPAYVHRLAPSASQASASAARRGAPPTVRRRRGARCSRGEAARWSCSRPWHYFLKLFSNTPAGRKFRPICLSQWSSRAPARKDFPCIKKVEDLFLPPRLRHRCASSPWRRRVYGGEGAIASLATLSPSFAAEGTRARLLSRLVRFLLQGDVPETRAARRRGGTKRAAAAPGAARRRPLVAVQPWPWRTSQGSPNGLRAVPPGVARAGACQHDMSSWEARVRNGHVVDPSWSTSTPGP